MFNLAKSTEYSRATTIVYTQEYPITLPMFGTGQMSRHNARCLPLRQDKTSLNYSRVKAILKKLTEWIH